MGGTCGMIWRIIGGWERPFNLNQVKVAFHRRHPSLIPGAFQISDTLSWLVSIGKLDRIDNCTFQRRQRKAHIQISLRRHPEPQMRMNFL